jgi:transaldolase
MTKGAAMVLSRTTTDLAEHVHRFVLAGFKPAFGKLSDTFDTNPLWKQLREVGTQLWLDTGSMDDAGKLWTQEFSALTTNNTLLNKEIQTGRYDTLITQAAELLDKFPFLSERQRILEIAFILNAYHGLRLVEKYDAFVSVEEHTDLATNVDMAVSYARRYHAICPERFIVKIPLTPAGLLATRILSSEGIPVNHTLGFSARQNYLIARIGRPAYVNVFLGRLNAFVVDNALGDGSYVGERAMLASQAAITALRQTKAIPTKHIGASFRSAAQVRDLAGIDVMTIPPKVAADFLKLGLQPAELTSKLGATWPLGVKPDVAAPSVGLNTLWDIDDKLVRCIDTLEQSNIAKFTPADLLDFFSLQRCSDVLVRWTQGQIDVSRKEGKIPHIENWREPLRSGDIGLDALMNLAGLYSFTADQEAMDERIRRFAPAPAARHKA